MKNPVKSWPLVLADFSPRKGEREKNLPCPPSPLLPCPKSMDKIEAI